MINSRSMEDLDPIAKNVCKRHMDLCAVEGIELIICSTYRDYEEQESLYGIGRTKFPHGMNTPIVTNARPGDSFHNFRCAWDCIPLVRGKADWNANDPIFKRMIELGIQAGAESGKDFPFKDMDHFQVRPRLDNDPRSYIGVSVAKIRFDQKGTIFT